MECADCVTGDAAGLVDCKTGAAAELVDCENSSCGIVGKLSDWGCSCVVGRLCDRAAARMVNCVTGAAV